MNTRLTVSPAFYEAAIKEAENCLGADAGALSEELYTEFARNGNRTNYEGVNFRRRRLLNRLALGELCEGKGRFLSELFRIVSCTLDERSWVLPAHSGGALPDGAETNIDLFSAQTAAALAMISARLPLETALQQRIWEAIDARIFMPFLTHDYWWRDLGANRRPVPSNWTPWCVHGVLECVRAVLPDALPWCGGNASETNLSAQDFSQADAAPSNVSASVNANANPACLLPSDRLPQLKEIADSCLGSLHNYFEDYPNDGGCDEGAQYWEHSVGHFFECGLWQAFDAAKLSSMCTFIQKAHMTGDYYMNFADCAARITPNPYLIFQMGEAGIPELSAFGASLYRAQTAAAPDITLRDNMDFRAVLNAALVSPAMEAFAGECVTKPCDRFASLAAGIFRNEHFCTAVKGGHNGENHNHNDCGNVIVYADGRPVLIDVGVGAYTKDTFSERRYTIWTMQSSFHNLPEINGCMQREGAAFAARDVIFSDASFSCELSAAYPQEAGILSYERRVHIGEKCVKLTSRFSFCEQENSLILNYMLSEKPELKDCRARVNGCLLKLPPGKWSIETIEFGDDEKLSPVWGHCVYRLRGILKPCGNEFTAVTILERDTRKGRKLPEYTVIRDDAALSLREDNAVSSDLQRKSSFPSDTDLRFMREALKQAKKAAAAGDVPIGCVITHGEQIIARAYNKRNKNASVLAHAETLAIEKAAKKCRDFRLEDCTLYVTLEPCPMCAGAIVQARIPRVIIGAMNPKAGCAGSILNLLQNPRFNHRSEIVTGVCREEAAALLSGFFRELRAQAAEQAGTRSE